MDFKSNSTERPKSNLTYDAMLKKLDELYDRKDRLETELEDLGYDIEFLENMIMYRFTKEGLRKR